MLDIFIQDLPVHTIFLSPLLCVVLSTSDRGGGIRRQRLVHLGEVVGWVHLGIRLDISKGGVT